jgi:hypothetical protein
LLFPGLWVYGLSVDGIEVIWVAGVVPLAGEGTMCGGTWWKAEWLESDGVARSVKVGGIKEVGEFGGTGHCGTETSNTNLFVGYLQLEGADNRESD